MVLSSGVCPPFYSERMNTPQSAQQQGRHTYPQTSRLIDLIGLGADSVKILEYVTQKTMGKYAKLASKYANNDNNKNTLLCMYRQNKRRHWGSSNFSFSFNRPLDRLSLQVVTSVCLCMCSLMLYKLDLKENWAAAP